MSQANSDHEFEATISAYHGGIYRRKDFVGREDAAKSHPNRTYYFRKDVDDDALASACSRRIEENPYDPKPFCIRGSILAKRGKHEDAVKDFTQALQLVPRDAACLYGRGLSLEKCGKLNEAIQDFTTILTDVDPGNYAVAYARADCYNRLGDFEAAIRDYDFALSRDNTKKIRPSTPRFFKGQRSQRSRSPATGAQEALLSLESSTSASTSPDNVPATKVPLPAHNTSSDMSQIPAVISAPVQSRETDDSPRHIEQTSKSPDVRAAEHHQRGFALRKQGKYAEAVMEYSKSLEIRPNSFKALFNRGFALDKLQRFTEAIDDYSKAVEIDPENPYVMRPYRCQIVPV